MNNERDLTQTPDNSRRHNNEQRGTAPRDWGQQRTADEAGSRLRAGDDNGQEVSHGRAENQVCPLSLPPLAPTHTSPPDECVKLGPSDNVPHSLPPFTECWLNGPAAPLARGMPPDDDPQQPPTLHPSPSVRGGLPQLQPL
jgi:hypothetical protein